MSEKIRSLKEDAAKLIAKGKIADAVAHYVDIVKADPRDLSARQKLAELQARLGHKAEAVREYQGVAGRYAADGMLLKAIAVCKIILQIDPAHNETQHFLADLTTKKRGDKSAVQMPSAMSAALAPARKRSAADIRGIPASRIGPTTASLAETIAAGAVERSIPIDFSASASMELTSTFQPTSAGSQMGLSHSPLEQTGEQPVVTQGLMSFEQLMARTPAATAADLFEAARAANAALQDQMLSSSLELSPTAHVPALSSAPLANEPPPLVMGSVAPSVVSPLSSPHASIPHTSFPQNAIPQPSVDVDYDELLAEDVDDGQIIELQPAQIDVDQIPPIPLFSDLPREAFISLTERMDLRIAQKGDMLVQEGEPGHSMFVIIQGRVGVRRKALEGEGNIDLADLGEGAFFGEMSLLSAAPRTASVICLEDTMAFELSRELIQNIAAEHPSVEEVMKRFHKNRLLTNLLKTSPIFAPYSAQDKKNLIERFKSRSVGEGAYLVTREKPGDGLYVVLSGRCHVYGSTDDGKELFLAELREGDVFGEMSMLWNKNTCASVKAMSPCIVLRLPRESFQEVISVYPQILETLTHMSERRQKQNLEQRTPAKVNDWLM